MVKLNIFLNLLVKKKRKNYDEIMILSTSNHVTNKNIIVGLVTTHIPLKDVSRNLTVEKIISKTVSFNSSLKKIWGIKKPHIGICGLNPHSGESGLLGFEEEEIIKPAISILKKKKILVMGPLSPDSSFTNFSINKFDGILCMYHDQGLIPVKTIDFYNSVNVTGGLPILRVSPDHGPAFDISTQFIARNDSLISALKLAEKYK